MRRVRNGEVNKKEVDLSGVQPTEPGCQEVGRGAKTEGHRDPVVWTAELDAIISEGYEAGWRGALQAINQIQGLHPKWRSHWIWDRAERLGFDQAYVQKRPPWSASDDAMLLDFAEEQSVMTIARWLHRSEAAVRWRFARLGKSARVRDNYTQEELARDLRVSPKTVRRWESAGLLERRDGRITHESFEEFCRKHGSEVNFGALDPEMQEWLKHCAGLVPTVKESTQGEAALKHLQKVGVCPWCGRRTRGNAHARHLRACARRHQASRESRVQDGRRLEFEGHLSGDPTTNSSASRRQT